MVRFEQQTSPTLLTVILLSMGAILFLDGLSPLGFAEWVFYLVPVSLSLFAWRPGMPVLVAFACTLLIAGGMFISAAPQPGLSPWIPRLNRLMAVAALWTVAVIARQFIITRLQLREQEWIRSGQGELGTRMQGEQDPAQLGDSILRFLAEYLKLPVAVLYSAELDGSLCRRAAYAADRSQVPPERLAPGEGLLGQAVKDRRIIRFDELPEGYLPISSALGKTRPAHLVVLPVEVDGAVRGALELGFLRPVDSADLELLSGSAEPIAIALRSSQYRARLQELLEETQRQTEELQAQQEELRVSNEELEEQSRALRESQARLEAQQAELEQTNTQLEEQASALQRQRDDLSRAQLELIEKAEELTRANQYKSEFLANMSHELRTPLNSTLILAKLLADNGGGNLTAEQVNYASTIYSSGNDLLVLINDILDLSRIEAGRMELHAEEVELARLAESIKRSFQPLAAESQLGFEVELAPGLPATIHSDGLRLQQILRNLLSNAFKFTSSGSVLLRVAAAPGQQVSFSVRDSGIGIPPDRQQVIFEAFRQADGTTNRKYGGTGLGLTISRELARRLGGDILVESTAGQGSIFTLTIPQRLELRAEAPAMAAPEPARGDLPRAEPAALAAQQPARAGGAVRQPMPQLAASALPDDRATLQPGERSILIIEDDLTFARILRDLAREQRFRALIAASVSEGLQLAEQFVPDAVLLDIQLPDSSGLLVLQHLKQNPRLRHIPVHVISALEHTQQALEMGAVGYALKPVQREQLVEALQRLEQRLEQKLRQVLVVEDVSVQRESIVQLLKAENVSIVPVATGAEALQRLKESSFDCMVLDLILPDMSGYDLLDRMAAGEAFSFPPVIVYTGRSLDRPEEERLRRYASSIIIKGARSPERLLDEVTLFLHQLEGSLSLEQQRILSQVRNREAVLEGKRILVVDDDARNVFALASALESKGARLRFARNGKEALDALQSDLGPGGPGLDLVLMDLMMPEMDGLTATREIRKRPEWKKLPIIALTAKAMPRDREDCLRAGADDYIAKPLDLDKLLSLIKVWISR